MTPPPHRTLVCARCGAHPRWVLLDPNDPRPVALCSRCSQHNDYDCTPPTPPAIAAPLPKVSPLPSARGSSIPTPVALAAVFVAAFLPNAAVAAWRGASRVAPAIDAALRVLDGDNDLPPHAPRGARARALSAPTPQPVRLSLVATSAPIAQPILVPCSVARAPITRVDDGPSAQRGLLVTRAFARSLPPALGLRERDVITHLDGRSVLDEASTFRVCGLGERSFVLSGERDGRAFSRLVPCASVAARREVARRPAALITASR